MDPVTFIAAQARLAHYEALKAAAPARKGYRRLPGLVKLLSAMTAIWRPTRHGQLEKEASLLAAMGKLHG